MRPRPGLTRRRVLEAALALVDRDGVEALSMRRLGASLDVEAMSLYRHVAGKEAVLDGVVELLIEELEVPADGDSWQEGIREVVRSYRRLAHRHPNAFQLIALREVNTTAAVERAGAVIDILRRGGFGPRAALYAFRTISTYAAGSLLDELTSGTPDQREEREATFEWGLRVLLTGLEAELPRGAPPHQAGAAPAQAVAATRLPDATGRQASPSHSRP